MLPAHAYWSRWGIMVRLGSCETRVDLEFPSSSCLNAISFGVLSVSSPGNLFGSLFWCEKHRGRLGFDIQQLFGALELVDVL